MDFGPEEHQLYDDARRLWRDYHKADSAIDLLKKAVAQNEKYTDAWKLLGYIYTFKRDEKAAVECWRKCCEIDPNDWEATRHYLLGVSEEDDIDELIDYWKNLAPKAKPYAKRYHIIGSIFKQLHRYNEALQAYCQAIKLENERKNTLKQIFYVLKKQGKTGLAAKFNKYAENPEGKAKEIINEISNLVD